MLQFLNSHHNRIILLHSIFWLGYLGFTSAFFADFYNFSFALQRSLINGFFHAVLVYLNILVLIPRFLEKKKFLRYGLWLLLLGLVYGLLRLPFEMMASKHIIELRNEVVSSRPGLMIFLSFTFILLISSSYKLAEGWFQNLTAQKDLKNKQLEAELKFLKTQINPHFLFNTLNNIYTLCYLKEDNAATMVMKLSNLMRYMLYECGEDLMPLYKETAFLNDYIELQKLKKEGSQNIRFEINGIQNQHQIPPLLLLPLVENAFKHGNTEENAWVNIDLEVDELDFLHFKISNTIKPKAKTDSNSGIGLENTQRRLDLIYPDNYELDILQDAKTFTVYLIIPLNKSTSK